VGIGTTSPTSRLTISDNSITPLIVDSGAGADNTRGIAFNVGGNNYGRILTASGSGGAMAFWTGAINAASERLRIDISGNVGIGTSSPAVPLEVGGQANPQIRTLSTTGAVDLRMWSSGNVATGIFGTLSNHPLAIFTNNLERIRITSTGNVGIGTTSPATTLDVLGATSDQIRLRTDSLLFYRFGRNTGTGLMDFWGSQTGFTGYTFGGVDGERMRITSTGNVGIGNTAPITPLHVTGATVTTGVVYKNQPAQTSKAAAATLTIAELLTGIIQYTGALATLTMPTGTNIEGGVPATFPTDMSFDFSVINTGSGTATLGTATGLTLTGSMAVTAATSVMFRVRKTATNTYTVYRIG